MFRRAIILLSALVISPCFADPLTEARDVANSKNPVGAALSSSSFGCFLLGPPSPQRDLAGSPGPGVAGTITVPKGLGDGYSYDLSVKGQLCQLTDNTKIPFIDLSDPKNKSKIVGGVQTIVFKNEIAAQLKLTMGTWLNLIDFNAEDLEEVGIYISAETYDLSEQKLRTALLNMRKESGNACSALTDPAARQIVRSCYGLITISLQAKKNLSLNVLDLKFANLVVGLNARWLRDVKGASADCSPPGGAAGASSPNPVASANTGGAGGVTAPVPANSNGVEANIKLPAGVVPILPAGLEVNLQLGADKIAVKAPSAADVAKSKDEPQNKAKATPAAVKAANDAKPAQPPAQDKICVQNVIYRTSDVMIIGANFLDAKTTKKNQDWLKKQP
ncbi:hypothetical protein [Afipia clevelandensis]|uniref:Uncharacterized protein n=1 Tax=Afipia clevelandensis ATCC 49720 TaxID=883079 RepID=K8P2K5_9BRAD|nr:hypothetical protein [Afipia clevelandensis]EKS32663.1 hypothetical protein HMPREF9696_03640 [Afipia clevelandensis ATCC 49720]